jgi:hypothetical protein
MPVGDPVKFTAARCLLAAVRVPVTGEAAAVAAIGAGVSFARTVAEILYRERIAAAPKAPDSVLQDPVRLARLRAARSISIINADAFLAEHAGDEEEDRKANTERVRRSRANREAKIQADRAARIVVNKARRAAAKGDA